VSTVGRDEAAVRLYIQEQEKEDQRLDQLGLFDGQSRFERFTIYKPPALPEVADGPYSVRAHSRCMYASM
jgi:hypothetical protein